MTNDAPVAKSMPKPVPMVLLQAQQTAITSPAGKPKPWDKGHWANRK